MYHEWGELEILYIIDKKVIRKQIPRCRWVDNIKMYLREMGCGGMDCIDLPCIGTSGELL
jgi:hypothetical protein